jgi:type I restriction enzyme S subunit
VIEGLRPYPKMKPSGLGWLGDVPAHWDVVTLGKLGALFKGNGGSKADEAASGVPCVRYGDLYTRHEFFIHESRSFVNVERAASYTPIRYGDVLFAASGETTEDIGRSAANLIEGRAVCGGDVIVLRPHVGIEPKFLGFAVNSSPASSQKSLVGKGFTVVHIYAGDLKRIWLTLPPPTEQDLIVRFLTRADRLIGRYIRAKQALIRLLEEQKQAIICHAVTRGLNAEVDLKPSRIPWLGDIPDHWGVKRLKEVTNAIVDCLHATPEYDEDGPHPAIRTADIEPGRVRLVQARKVNSEHYARWTARLVPEPGDILYSREGERFGIAATVPAGVQLCISQRMMVFRVNPAYCADYVMWQINCPHVYARAAQDVGGSTAPHINISTIRNYDLAIPPRREQEAIAARISSESATHERAIATVRREIELLREYRTRLIADVVTGKLDVREAAARLPVEVGAEDAEMFDATDDLGGDEADDEVTEEEAA